MVHSIKYELRKPGQDYSGLIAAIKPLGAWWHYLDAHWLVDTQLSASQIFDQLSPHLDKNDSLLITSIGKDHAGWLPQEAWNWINARV